MLTRRARSELTLEANCRAPHDAGPKRNQRKENEFLDCYQQQPVLLQDTRPACFECLPRPQPKVSFARGCGGALSVKVETRRLEMLTVDGTAQDLERYKEVFGNELVMRFYSTGKSKSDASCLKRSTKWASLWQVGCPYSGFAIFRRDSNTFMGFVRLAATPKPGTAELTYALLPDAWGQGFATEAVAGILFAYVPALRTRGYTIGGRTLRHVISTVHPENTASAAVLHKCGMVNMYTLEKYDSLRHVFCFTCD